MSRLLIDCDGVLGDFLSPCLEITNRWMKTVIRLDHDHGCVQEFPHDDRHLMGWHPHPDRWDRDRTLDEMNNWNIFDALNVPPEIVPYLYAEMKREGWCESKIVPMPGARDGIEHLRDCGHEIFIVTSPMDGPTWTYERERWLKQHFDIDRKHVLHTDAKYIVSGDALIDDKPEHVREWAKHHPGKLGVLWRYVTNKHVTSVDWGGIHTNDWQIVNQFLAAYVESFA